MDKVLKFFNDRTEKYGAPYYTFSIFGLINYPLSFLFEYQSQSLYHNTLTIRVVATLLCLLLLLKNQWPKPIKKFLPIYWYATVTLSVPTLYTFLVLKNSTSLLWLMNYASAILILVLVLDWLMFIYSFFIGILIGTGLFYLSTNHLEWRADPSNFAVALYMYVIVYILASIFARNREMFNAKLLLVKDLLNQKLERQILEKTQQNEEVLEQKNKFLDNLSHEIRSSVQIITNLSSLASHDWDKLDGITRKSIISKINKSSSNLIFLINNVLDLSKFNSGRMTFDMKVNNLERVTKSVIEDLQILANEKNIKIDFYKNRHIELRTIFDKERISQVIRNLVINAIKYSNNDSNIRVDLLQKYATLPTGVTINGLCVSIKDEGIGVPEKELKTIFEPFETSSKNNKKNNSTGLGLSISLEIVNAHNGVIWVENNKASKGCTFYCVLPYSNNKINKNEDKSSKKKLTVLFVDDEEGCRIAGRMILENIGYNVKVFATGYDLLDFLKYSRKTPDLILLDMLMPDLDGFELVKKLRQISEYQSVPIVLQTGLKHDLTLNELKQYSPLGYIAKPYNKEQLKNEVEKYLYENNL